MTLLAQLQASIDTRALAIRETKSDWLCGKGCAKCCQNLAQLPQLTAREWEFLKQGLAALTPEHFSEIRQRVAALADSPTRPVVCPLLDQANNACPVYAHRPIACRTYGFYVQRELGMYCNDIASQVTNGNLANVVWGNHDAVDQCLSGLGEARSLSEWLSREAQT